MEFQASRPDTVQSRMNGKFGKEQQDWFDHEIKKPLGGSEFIWHPLTVHEKLIRVTCGTCLLRLKGTAH